MNKISSYVKIDGITYLVTTNEKGEEIAFEAQEGQ